jgi:succinate dehydrogenase/fumarate reductase flavoprotein subunit
MRGIPARVAVLHWMTSGLLEADMTSRSLSTTPGVSAAGDITGTHSKGSEAACTSAFGHLAWQSSLRYSHDLAPAATQAATCSGVMSPARITSSPA